MIGIYRIYHVETGKSYVGQSVDIKERIRQHFTSDHERMYIDRAINKHGKESFSYEVLELCSEEQLDDRECHWIASLDTIAPNGYNLRTGGANGRHSKETRKKISDDSRQRVADGTHNFLGGEIQRQKVIKGTHPFLGSEVNAKRVANGTHNFLSENLDPEMGKKRGKAAQRRVEEGTHHLLAENRTPENESKRLEGYNKWYQSLSPEKLKKHAKRANQARLRKLHKVYWCFIIAVARFRYETHDYREKRRREFFNQEILDTSNAEQLELF